MASLFNKIWSGLDFWDKDENRRQREQFAREEEERKRRERSRQMQVSSGPRPGDILRPPQQRQQPEPEQDKQFNFDEPLQKVGAYGTAFNNPIFEPKQIPKEQRTKQAPQNNDSTAGKVSSLTTRRVGTGIIGGFGGTYDLLTPGKGTNRVSDWATKTAKSIDQEARDKGVETPYRVANVPAEFATYLTPGVVSKLSKVSRLGGKVIGKAQDIIGNTSKARRLASSAAEEFLDPRNLEKEVELTSRYIGQDVAKGEDIGAGDIIGEGALGVAGAFLPPFIRRALNRVRGGEAVEEATERVVKDSVPAPTTRPSKYTENAELPGTQRPDSPSSTEVAPGVKLSPSSQLEKEAYDLDRPAYQRTGAKDELARQAEDARRAEEAANIDSYAADTPLDEPTFQYRNNVQDIINQGRREFEDFIQRNPGATQQQIEAAEESINQQVVDAVQQIQGARYGDFTPANVPDPDNPIALAKADVDAPAGATDDGAMMADFKQPVDGSRLQKAGPLADTDAQGNPAFRSDAQRAQELAEQGMAPSRGDSVSGTREAQMARRADEAAEQQFSGQQEDYSSTTVSIDELRQADTGPVTTGLTGAPAPRTRERAASKIMDDDLRADVLGAFPEAKRMDIEGTQRRIIAELNQTPIEDVVRVYNNPDLSVSTPEGFFRGVESIRRLERLNTPEADNAIKNIVDALSEFSSQSGRNLRTTQILFDDMPVTMKAKYLIDRMDKAMKKAGIKGDIPEDVQSEILRRVEIADDATDNLRKLEAEAAELLDDLKSGRAATPETAQRAADLSRRIDEARAEKEVLSGRAWRYYQEQLPPSTLGSKFADVGRTLMLSAPSGRIFDQISTAATALNDLAVSNISSLIGKGANLVKGRGATRSSFTSPRKLIKGLREGAGRVVKSARGEDYVESLSGNLQRSTRGDINTGGGPVRRIVRTATEAPTNLTRGIREDRLYREGMQEASEMGLTGQARRSYAELRASIPGEQQLRAASEAHMATNMLHNNPITRKLNQFARSLDDSGHGLGALFIRNQVAPFTSWLGGNLHRTLTDKNLLYNVWDVARQARRGNAQGVIDGLSQAAVNTGQAYVLGYGLTEAGVLTDTDANGNSYGGLYINIGDRYMPVAILGVNSVPLIFGNAVHKGMQASEDGAGFVEATANTASNTLVNTAQNAGVASVFGGNNTAQDLVNSVVRQGQKDPEDRNLAPVGEYFGDVARQYVPGFGADANSFLDNYTELNPTNEAPKTDIKERDPITGEETRKKDVLATEVAKTKSRIPFLSQTLEREEGQLAKDPIDRITKGNRETGEQAQQRATEQTLEEQREQLEADKIPLTVEGLSDLAATGDFDNAVRGAEYRLAALEASEDSTEVSKINAREDLEEFKFGQQYGYVPSSNDAVEARAEEGNYDAAIAGWEYRLARDEAEGDTPKSKLEEQENKIGRYKVFRDMDIDPEMVAHYENGTASSGGIGKEDWQDMMDSGDPELVAYAEELYNLDRELFDAGLIDKQKYGWGKSGRGSRGGRGSGPKFVTDIATQSAPSFNFSPIKAQSATFGQQQSPIPTLEKLPNYSRKPKKISVTRGRGL